MKGSLFLTWLPIKWHALVNLVDPIAKQQMRICPPPVKRSRVDIIVRIVTMRRTDMFSSFAVPVELFFQGAAVIFDMVENIKIARGGFQDQARAGKIAINKQLQLRACLLYTSPSPRDRG